MAESPLSASLAELSRFFVGDGTVKETLDRVTELTLQAVDSADLVGITMIVEGRQRTAVFTDDRAPEIDQAQYDADSGPCLDAFRLRQVTEVTSTREPGPWPEFRRAAAEHGILSTLSLPLAVEDNPLGAMNLYARRERAFSDADRADAALFAAQASIVLANAQAYWDAHQLSTRLAESMQRRAVIEQAKGILMAAQGIDEDGAFDLLVRASQRENVKLRDIAQRIVTDAVARRRTPEADG